MSSPDESKDSNSIRNRAASSSVHESVSARSFYGSSNPGSSRTGYIAPAASPYREPQLVQEEPLTDIITDESGNPSWSGLPGQTWGTTDTSGWGNHSPMPWDSTWSGGTGLWQDSSSALKVTIDGRSSEEELRWYDKSVRDKHERPGPGILPPMLADALHDPDHTLYSVSVSDPPYTRGPLSPSSDEARTAVPHPRAYYCREHNGWVLLIPQSSSVLPPLARTLETPLPDQNRRKITNSCVGKGEQLYGQVNATHHWHRYERAVDATKLNPPFMRDDTLLDLYLCCQCSTYCLVSDVIPGVLPVDVVNRFTRERLENPSVGRTGKATALAGWETIVTIVENRLWKDEQRILPVDRPKFQQKIGWNDDVRQILEVLGFSIKPSPEASDKPAAHPPPIDPSTAEGKQSRKKLLRAWAEITALLNIFKNSKGDLGDYNPQVPHGKVVGMREDYQTDIGAHVNQIPRGLLPDALVGHAALDESWKVLGLTPSTYSPELLAFAYLAQCRCDPARTPLYFTHFVKIVETMTNAGVAPTELQQLVMAERERHRYTDEDLHKAGACLGFGHDGELRVELDNDVDDNFILGAWRDARRRAWQDPARATSIRNDLNIALKIIADDKASEVLQKAWEEEKGTGMSPDAAYSTLEVPKDVDETMLMTVYQMRVDDQPSQAERMREALTVIAEVTGSERLRQYLTTGQDPGDATQTARPEMPRGLNQLGNTCYLNSLLQYFYTIKDLRAAIALLTTAEGKTLDDKKFTDDDLKRHRVGGRLVTRREIARSKKFVNQLADLFWNLEYCDVPAVTPSIDLAKLALVTSQDEEEEDQDKAGTDSSNDTDATLVDDAPPRPSHERSVSPQVASPTESVLGKRQRELEVGMDVDTSAAARGSSHDQDDRMASIPLTDSMANQQAIASSSKLQPIDLDDVMMLDGPDPQQENKPPPLPPRKSRPVDDSVMMFGRQHDVSECMDNCIFQIETALLDFEDMTGTEDDKTSVVKRLFYGKKRQRLTPLMSADDLRHKSSIHEKEDLFSHLHVNVADEGFDLYDGLSRYFDDVVDFDGFKKRMEVSLVDLPPLLQIQLQRVQFDRETQQAYKSQAYVKFDEAIFMDRFLDTGDPDKKTRSKVVQIELNASREKIQRLTHDKHAPFAPALGGVADFLSKQTAVQLPEADDDLIGKLRSEQDFVTAQLEQERNNAVHLKSQIEDIWGDDQSAAYELTSVFIHRGSSPSWGHYFFYSRNLPNNPDQWFKYNDSDVSVVSKDEVLADTTGSNANPYMLVFARKGSEAIETVHRFDPAQLQDA
ncbi:cysteine proteinase [Wolfiporia cocos MD-104 SS10]|uniref:ubiquitinyl hydrolase 1 n=1 Tax=Wolfiporia cocos (strain MD-104) TaxID=742152 RepID=A0A2H3JA00_WOLCO|nr:cysteine proteinase [Wolfiporia cocos MD-104 SS10]